MFTRPSLRAVLATTAAAALLVGGANLASYAATHHGHAASGKGSAQPKAISFHLGIQGHKLAGGAHLFTAKVPKGTYSVGMSGVLLDANTGTDSYFCTLADKKSFVHLIKHPGTNPDFSHLYEINGQSQSDGTFDFGLLDGFNPVAKITLPTIVYGCILSGTGPFTLSRVPTFTLTPVKVTTKKGSSFPISRTQVRKLVGTFR